MLFIFFFFFFSSRRRHTRWPRDWSSDVCSSDLTAPGFGGEPAPPPGDVEGLGVPATGGTFVGSGLAAVVAPVAAGVPDAGVPVCGVEGVVVLAFGLTAAPVPTPAGAPFSPGMGSVFALGSGWV